MERKKESHPCMVEQGVRIQSVQCTRVEPAHPQQVKVTFWSAGEDPKYTVV